MQYEQFIIFVYAKLTRLLFTWINYRQNGGVPQLSFILRLWWCFVNGDSSLLTLFWKFPFITSYILDYVTVSISRYFPFEHNKNYYLRIGGVWVNKMCNLNCRCDDFAAITSVCERSPRAPCGNFATSRSGSSALSIASETFRTLLYFSTFCSMI